MKTHDSMGRRLHKATVSTGKKVMTTDLVVHLMEKGHRHGDLSSNFYFKYGTLKGYSEGHIRNSFTKWSNEVNTEQGGRFFEKVDWQLDTAGSDYHHTIYRPTLYADNILMNRGLFREYALPPITRSNSYKHDYGTSAIMASIEIATMETENVRFIFGDELLERAGVKIMSFDTDHGWLRPDGIFGLEYTDGEKKYYRAFVLEYDRATEPIKRSANGKKSYEQKFHQYRDFIAKKKYRDALKLTCGLFVLNVTTEVSRMKTMKDTAQKLSDGVNNYQLFYAVPHMSGFFKPSHVMTEMFTAPLLRAGADPIYLDHI